MLGEGPTYGNTGGFSSQEKKIIINFSKARAKFCLTLHYNGDSSVNEKEIYKLKANDKILTFQLSFVSEVYLMDLLLLRLEKFKRI